MSVPGVGFHMVPPNDYIDLKLAAVRVSGRVIFHCVSS